MDLFVSNTCFYHKNFDEVVVLRKGQSFVKEGEYTTPLTKCGKVALLAQILFKTLLTLGFCWLASGIKKQWTYYKSGKTVISIYKPKIFPLDKLGEDAPPLKPSLPPAESPKPVLAVLYKPELIDDVLLNQIVKENPDLEILNLSGSKVSDIGLGVLKGLKKLKSLDLSCCPQFTDLALVRIGRLNSLQSLDLHSSDSITTIGLAHIKYLVGLRELNLAHCSQVGDTALYFLKKFLNLRALNLTGCQITDEGLRSVLLFKELQILVLADTQISDNGLACLSDLKKLQGLDVSHCNKISDKGLVQLEQLLPKLKNLKG